MVAHQPHEQVGFVLAQEMVGSEAAGVFHAQLGMVAAAPFGDVVKQGGQIQHGFALESVHQGAGKRQLVAVRFQSQPAHIAHHHQDVVVHGVNVEQVVLQQADDFVPLGQVMRKRAVEVEEAQQVGEPAAVAEEAHEAAAVGRIGIKTGVGFLHRLPPGAQGFGGEAGEVAVLLPQLQHFENMLRLAAE